MSDTGSSIVLDTHRPMNMNEKSEDVYILYVHIMYHILFKKAFVCEKYNINIYIYKL